jgi:hypothetical protein
VKITAGFVAVDHIVPYRWTTLQLTARDEAGRGFVLLPGVEAAALWPTSSSRLPLQAACQPAVAAWWSINRLC